jgi:hypothetical protein
MVPGAMVERLLVLAMGEVIAKWNESALPGCRTIQPQRNLT